MISNIKNALMGILANTNLQHANGAGRLFELFIMTSIADALRIANFNVWLQRSDGSRIYSTDTSKEFVQRGGAPTGVLPANQGTNNGSSICFQRGADGPVWEIWNGIQFEGRSGAVHEIDIAVVPQQLGTELRISGGYPFGRPHVAIECKDVSNSGGMDEMRAFVARLYDITLLNSHIAHTSYQQPAQRIYATPASCFGHGAFASFWVGNRDSFNAIARRSGFSSGSLSMTTYYAIEPYGYIIPNTVPATELFKATTDWIKAHCQ